MKQSIAPEDIDALLPQTQCGLCGYKGCMPYAEALVKKEAAINLCLPGGVDVLSTLGDRLRIDARPFVAEMEEKAKPRVVAVIREYDCIGCTKCIQACPVDAILGGAKQLHTVLTEECTGCELCIAPCPVDCIDLVPVASITDIKSQADHYRQRYSARQERLKKERMSEVVSSNRLTHPNAITKQTSAEKKAYIQAALQRVKSKKK